MKFKKYMFQSHTKDGIREDMHVIPLDDVIDHDCNEACQCGPEQDTQNRKEFVRGEANCKVWIHKRIGDHLQ